MMTKILISLVSAYLALGGSVGVEKHSLKGDGIYTIQQVRDESDIDEIVYDVCMEIMNECDYNDIGTKHLLDYYQKIAQDEELNVVEKSALINKINPNDIMNNNIIIDYVIEDDSVYVTTMSVEGV